MPSDHEVVMARIFDAPRELLWRANTDPTLIPQWWGLGSLTTVVDKMELRLGGAWRYVQRSPGGQEYAFNGVYREIVPPERLASTFEFEAMPGRVSVNIVTLEEQGAGTKMSVKSVFETRGDRDALMETGMEQGFKETTDRLGTLVARLKFETRATDQRDE